MINITSLPTLSTSRLVLRELTETDIPALYTIFSHPEVMRYWSFPPLNNQDDAKALLNRIQNAFEQKRLFQWGIALKDGDGVIGTCTLLHIDLQNRRAEVGYILGRDYWGQGYMTETLTVLHDYAFLTHELNRLEADVDPRNTASIRLLERLGYQREGYLRERWLVGNETQDSLLLGLLKREWLSKRTSHKGTVKN